MEMELGKLFIGGISWDTNEDRLREYFQNFGEVIEAVIMRDRTTGRARGFGFVVFADPTVAEKVVLEKHLIDGRNVEAKKAVLREDQNNLNKHNNSIHGSPGPARTKKIFVGGLGSTVTETDFKRYFDQFGTITDVVVMYDHNTQRPRGFGFITYDSEEAVDKVLHKTFHELNGKMVEVKRAVPKELSPGPTRTQLGGLNYGLGKVGGLFNGYNQGFNLSSLGGFGARMDGRFSPTTIGRNNFSSLAAGYGVGMNLEQGLGQNYGGNLNLTSNPGYGRIGQPYGGSSGKYGSPIGYIGGSGGSSPGLNSPTRTLWGSGSTNYVSSSGNSTSFVGYGNGSSGMDSFGSMSSVWGSNANSRQGGGPGFAYSNGNLGNSSTDFSVNLGGSGYGRNGGSSFAPVSSHVKSNGCFDNAYSEINENNSIYGDSTWHSLPSELDEYDSFGFGLGNAAADVLTKNSAGYVGGYTVANRQSNRGIAA